MVTLAPVDGGFWRCVNALSRLVAARAQLAGRVLLPVALLHVIISHMHTQSAKLKMFWEN